MSVATNLVPEVYIPEPARRRRTRDFGAPGRVGITGPQRPVDPARVIRLFEPPVAATVRLTRRGIVALATLVGAVALGVVALAATSAPAAPSIPAPDSATVLVRPGDTLWSIALQVAPDRDPRAEVGTLQRRNRLVGTDLVPGQLLQIR